MDRDGTKRPKVSVAIITYNHERYIEQAIDSVLMQQVDFEYEIIVGDDLSQDKTREILHKYKEKYPDKITLLLYETKQGPGGNCLQVLSHCKGEYIALLEGDDYWTAPQKLQTQVNYLDQHPQCVLCSHAVQNFHDGRQELLGIERYATGSATFGLTELLNGEFSPRTGASVLRNGLLILPDWVRTLSNVDIVLFLLLAHLGTLDYLDDTYCVYRIHEGGIWSGKNRSQALTNAIATLCRLSEFYNHKYDKYDKFFNFHVLHVNACRAFYEDGNHTMVRYHLKQAIKHTRIRVPYMERLFKLIVFVYANRLYRWMHNQ